MKLQELRWLSILLIISSSCADQVVYLDDDHPGLIPKKYAVGIINMDDRFQQNMTMSPDGKEQLFTITDAALWRYESIVRVKIIEDEVLIDTPPFVADFQYENHQFIGEPMISPDNEHLYFIADYPPDIWHSRRTDVGDWSKPDKMTEISTAKDDWYVSLSRNGSLYFTNGTVYKSPLEKGQYTSKTRWESPFNMKDVRDPCISPGEDFMIFTYTDTLSTNQSDLFVSFKDDQGNWSEAKNLGKEINTEHREFAPYISPDEQFLFFSRRDQWQNAGFSNIYWVSLKVVEKLRP